MSDEVVCGNVAEACHCISLTDHEGPHICDCLGSWTWDEDRLVPVTFPGGDEVSLAGMLDVFDRLIGRMLP